MSVEVSNKIRDGVSIINAKTRVHLTDEQNEVVYHFNDSMAVFANPGTGKTTTAVNGLIAAQTLHGIPGNKINAMSFTRQATAEISTRYKAMCSRCLISPTVKFNTFHSICYRIIRMVYPKFVTRNTTDLSRELKDFQVFVKEEGVPKWDDMYLVKEIFQAVNSLNNQLLFSKSSVEDSAKFIKISDNVTLKQFQLIRARWFKRNFIVQSMPQGDIPTMVLFILSLYPEVAEQVKEEYELMVVDEFQDMSVLYLEVLALISKRLIVIGDLKQQIYGFNGASLLILDAYKAIYPDAPGFNLSQSFRCKNEIVKLANSIIEPNEIEGWELFKGIGDGGTVSIEENHEGMFDKVVESVKKIQDDKMPADIMFLARNNASVIPIIEQLYMKNIMFRTTKLQRVQELPIFKDMCIMAEVALHPTEPDKVALVNRFIPEFRYLPANKNPLLEVMAISPRQTDKNLLTMNYEFNLDSSRAIINRLRRFVELNTEQKQPFSVSCIPLFEIYDNYVLKGEWWKLENTKEYYFNLVDCIISNKTYESMIYDEDDKKNKNEYFSSMNEGVRCYTFHSSKGLEAETVYLLDVDDGILPKQSSINDLVEAGCVLDAARELRNERNLLYVAVTRCKKELHVVHNGEISTLISKPLSNGFTFLDGVYKDKAVLTNENKAFKILLGLKDDVC